MSADFSAPSFSTILDSISLLSAGRTRQVWYVAAPLRPTDSELARAEQDRAGDWEFALEATAEQHALRRNLYRAMRWLSWLRLRYPAITFIAPWIASVLASANDDEVQREAGLVDDCAVVARCDGIVLCGGRVSSGMVRERDCAAQVVDLTSLGEEPPGTTRKPDLSERLLVAAGRAEQ